ncbi:MAG TPA: deoxyribodipyrimidine photo-lyase [Sphingobacterium sp.]|nr:deoxyribodipyrimidine photo-lyase [Sphingobacterium sp.]
MKSKVSIFWFRRDLRLEDNVGLYHALSSAYPVLPVFIFDENILGKLEEKKDRRVDYFHQALSYVNDQLRRSNARLNTFCGTPLAVFDMLADQYAIQQVFCNRDYEPYAIQRDTEIYRFFKERDIPFKAFKDQVIFDKNEVVKNDGAPYTVYTPYFRKWTELLTLEKYSPYQPNYARFFHQHFKQIHSLHEIGFEKTEIQFGPPELDNDIIDNYGKYRDYPAMQCTTQLGISLRFGTISVRKCVDFALKHSQTWLKELVWREFFMQILYHFPKVVDQSFKTKYDNIRWRNNEQEFRRWCEGKTGYPIVDAGMRQLNETGFMHNRVRMIAASFLCKHLLIDWRWGEVYFAQKLNDYDLASNNGNWQWASGSGCDSTPYFRVFNPERQMERFDKELAYVKKWLPELGTEIYPEPIVEHGFARDRALRVYSEALKENI